MASPVLRREPSPSTDLHPWFYEGIIKVMEKQVKASGQSVLAVDENDNFLGRYIPRHRAHMREGIHHRAFVCFLINKKGEILLQKRRHWLWDNLWDVSAISHPLHLEDHDESYEEGASRALKKEMGVGQVALEKLGGFNYFRKHPQGQMSENEYCAIMFGKYDGKVKPDKEDVYEYKWMDFGQFVKETNLNPKAYTPWVVLMVKTLEKDGTFRRFPDFYG